MAYNQDTDKDWWEQGRAAIRNKDGLTWQQVAFVRSFVTMMIANGNKRPNAKECAIAAGCPVKTAKGIAYMFLQDANVRRSIEEKMEEHLASFDITCEKIVKELAHLAFSNMADYMAPAGDGSFFVDFSKLSREQSAAIQEITVDEYYEGRGENAQRVKKVRFKLGDKKGALDTLARWRKMLTDKTEMSNPDGTLAPTELHLHFVESDGDGRPKGSS